ncbi:MAG TPA: V-type ATPase subunit [candidate division Zixibacteria bacterium]|nr:V-type ATPase subunit [candidate division Zixibacteria bacterium]
MIRDAKDYGSLNVHMRAQRMELFTAGTYNLLVSATDFSNLSQMLANTKYNDIIGSEMVKTYPNLIEIDHRLTQNFVDQYNLYRKFIPKRAIGFVNVLIKIYYYNNVKLLLAALHNKDRLEEVNEMLITLNETENAEIQEMFKARNVETLVEMMPNEDLKKILNSALGDYHYLDLVYPLIFATDQYYYNMLCIEITKLSREDQRNTKNLFGTRIGLQNLEIILRSKTFDVSPNIVKNWLIATKLCPLRKDILEKLIQSLDLETTFNIIKEETPFRELAIRLLDNIEKELPPLHNFDQYAEQIVIHKANSIFRSASFNVSIFPAFFLLKEMEIRNLRTIILGKIHKRSANEILERIVLV